MKILLDIQGAQTESRFRGIGRQTASLADAIIRNAGPHDVHILLNHRLHESREELYRKYSQALPRDNIHIFQTPGGTAERDPENGWRTLAAEYIREHVIARLNPDILHMSSLFEGYVDDAVTSIGKLDANYITAVTLHDLIPLLDPKRYLSELRPRRHWYRRAQFLKRADLLLSVSEHSKREAVDHLAIPEDRVVVMSAGVESDFRPARSSDAYNADVRRKFDIMRRFFLHVGSVDPRKNVEYIFQAVSKLQGQKAQNYQIVFAGRLFPEEIARLKIAAARNGVNASSLRFCQFVSEKELVELYQTCDAVLFPSTHEGFGLPALEGMACGAPTFVANATSLPEVVGHSEMTFDPYQPLDLTQKLQNIIDLPEYVHDIREKGLARAATLTWDRSAQIAIAAFENTKAAQPLEKLHYFQGLSQLEAKRKKRMAFISPLPGVESGIATYSAQLLKELACHYEIECLGVPGEEVKDEWILANFTLRDVEFFKRNYRSYDVVIYSVGNNSLTSYMIPLLENYPGFVILHDFFLSDFFDWASNTGVMPYEDFFRVLYKTHGATALLEERRNGRQFAVTKFACNAPVFENALGVIVHSSWAIHAAKKLYGPSVADRMTVIPHLKLVRGSKSRDIARAKLSLTKDDILVCSFGHITIRKRTDEIVNAWLASTISHLPNARLVLIGSIEQSDYGNQLKSLCEKNNIHITGYASDELYQCYLDAADLAVQLRKESRGETSGTVLDALSAGVPVVIDGDGPFTELPKSIVVTFGRDRIFTSLQNIFEKFSEDQGVFKENSVNGMSYIDKIHAPNAVSRKFVEFFNSREMRKRASDQNVIQALADFNAPVVPSDDDFDRMAVAMNFATPKLRLRQILYDVTVLAESDAKTGIQRVVRGILANLIESPPEGFRIEPVRMDGHQLRYARQFNTHTFDIPSWVYPDSPVDYDEGDIYLSIDWVPDRLMNIEGFLADFRRNGGRSIICVHDLLPLEQPQFFPDFMEMLMQRWFQCALRISDQLVCVSQTTAQQVAFFADAMDPTLDHDVAVDYFPLAADIAASLPSQGVPENGLSALQKIQGNVTFLMVGTIEPRKGHRQIFEAMRRLWREGANVNLVIVGKKGWMMDEFCTELKGAPQYDKSLFWFDGISDEFLERLYEASTALIAASEGEGFGLPIVEAIKHGKPLIARDIPVFREVAGDDAFYFSESNPDDTARRLKEWIALYTRGKVPESNGRRIYTWKEATEILIDRIFSSKHYLNICAEKDENYKLTSDHCASQTGAAR
ncbi:glycosyltransferase [Gluconacetobacter johannae DSM 13595]|uniref:Glycosyltransferase n=1 Tax=Gluconacetobacter johannae TaxID=112140 RepID=A0A7W4P6R5_9PROT|nr:glycosyltransferase [Gluconacetobacter johannae]MBB2177538.1 glycosyltransferase [Gluconacetobacter johannae]GBQ85567.1 glycosyltransferase [Gluconacetobacter johannae DSM 13595]